MDRPSLLTIYNRIIASFETQMNSSTPILRYSMVGIISMVMAGASHLMYGFIFQILDNLFPDTARVKWLRRLAVVWGVPIKSDSQARGVISVTSLESTTLYAGTQFQNDDGIVFETIIDYIFNGAVSSDVNVQAVIAGTTGNISDSSLVFVSPPSDFNTTATVLSAPSGGADAESIEDLRERFLARWANRMASGSVADIKRQCLSVDGVSHAWILPAEEWKGAGTVGCIIAGKDVTPLSQAVIDEVQAVVDENEVVGATSTVQNAFIDEFIVEVSISPNTSAIREQITQNITQSQLDNAVPGGDIKISTIRDAISAVLGPNGDYLITLWYGSGWAVQFPNENKINDTIGKVIYLCGGVEFEDLT